MNTQASLFIGLALLAGAGLPLQAGLNARMGKHLGHPVLAALLSFAVGFTVLLGYSALTRLGAPTRAQLASAAPANWLAGVVGAFYVAVIVMVTPRLGAATTFALVIAGQLVLSLVVDHFGLFGLPVQPINLWKLLGVLLLMGGVLVIKNA